MTIVEDLIVNGVTEILKKLLPQIGPVWNVKGDLQALEKTLEMILASLSDAQNRQVNENSVKVWLKRLRDVAYDAEDVLDEFAYELMRRDHIMNLGGERDMVSNILLSVPVINNISFDYEMANKIKTINTNLDALTKDMAKFGFNQLGSTSSSSTSDQLQWDDQNNTDSYGDETEINVERENDISSIVGSLIKSHDDEKISVMSIVGMGGIGKTTLAQKVYNHETVTKHFDLKIWVYISDRDIVVDKVSKDILDTVTRSTCDTPTTDVLVRRLRTELFGKKYLLVLDDFWDKNIGKWASLKRRLVVGAQGSRILVTTRSLEVASNVRGAISPYILQQISNEGCWSIIKHRAFSPGGARESSNMIDLGKDIASKCGGLPLVAQTLGSLMHNTNQQSDWLEIKDNPVMKSLENETRIKELLKLSYDRLWPILKRCFSYCSIIPRGWVFKREIVVQLWIAEGFVPSPMEEQGNKFFNILVNNSLLQTHSPKLDKYYRMHDLIHDLAQSVSEDNEFFNVKVSEMDAISNKEVRRLRVDFDKKEISTTFPKKLRTFLTFNAEDPWESNCVFSNKYLRVLCLVHPTITSSPLSFAELKHLRYLNLEDCSVQLHDLTIGALYNLQTFLLKNCWDLRGIPNDIGALKNLRHLSLVGCPEVEELPKSICSLSNLQYLFLRHCTKLEGLPSDIGNLKKLKILNLTGSEIKKLPDSINDCHDLEVLNVRKCENLNELPKELGALKRLRVLNISSTSIRGLPDSITELTELTELKLQESKVDELPQRIGDLKLLRKLNLRSTKISFLPDSCSSAEGLCNLEELHLGDCQTPRYIGNWTNLRILGWFENHTIGTMLGMDRLTRLETLERYDVSGSNCVAGGGGIGDLGGLNLIGGHLTINYLKRVRGGGIEEAKLANLSEKSNITCLTLNWQGPHSAINDDDDVDENGHLDEEVLEGLQPHSNLEEISIDGYKGLKLASWMAINMSLPNLACLTLEKCNGIQQIQGFGQLPHLKQLTLTHMENLEEWIEEETASCYFPMLVFLVIKFCPKLITFPTTFPCLEELAIEQVNAKVVLNINNITSLKRLAIGDVYDIGENGHLDEDVLEGLQPHSNLKIMEIKGYKGLKLPSWITNTSFSLPNLVELHLINCKRIQQLGGLGLLPQLKYLTLDHMENLEEWIEEEGATTAAESTRVSSCYFPMLLYLVIEYCPKLITLPTIVPCLLTLIIKQVNAKVLNITNTSLQHLSIRDVPQLEFLPRQILNPALSTLYIHKCPNFQGFLPHIQDIDLQDVKSLEYLDIEWLHPESDSTKKFIEKKIKQVKSVERYRYLDPHFLIGGF